MRTLKAWTLIGVVAALALAAQATAARPGPIVNSYVVGSLTIPGVSTGLVLEPGQQVEVTATGAMCPWGVALAYCVGPDGDVPGPLVCRGVLQVEGVLHRVPGVLTLEVADLGIDDDPFLGADLLDAEDGDVGGVGHGRPEGRDRGGDVRPGGRGPAGPQEGAEEERYH